MGHCRAKQHTVQIGAAVFARRLFRSVLRERRHHGPPPLWHGHTAHSREVSIPLVSALPSSGEGSTNDAEDASSVALMGRLYPDYFDIAYACFEGGFRDLIIAMAERGEAMAAPLFFVLELTLLSLLVAHVRWSRPLAKGKKFVGRAPPSWTLLVLAMDIGPYRAQAMAPGGPSGQLWPPHPPPRPTDLELWCSGQCTVAEELALALQREVYARPLSSGGRWPTSRTPDLRRSPNCASRSLGLPWCRACSMMRMRTLYTCPSL